MVLKIDAFREQDDFHDPNPPIIEPHTLENENENLEQLKDKIQKAKLTL